jgi:tripartite-type tricarboxylate transporter receptor subunit TctC
MNKKQQYLIAVITVFFFSMLIAIMSIAEEAKYPVKPITLVIQFPPGGGADIAGRSLSNVIKKYFGQPFIVINKPGGAGIVAGDFVTKGKPDGYAIGGFVSTGCNPELYSYFRKATYTYMDLKPIIRFTSMTYCLVSRSDGLWSNLREFIDYAKKHPKQIKWAHQGVGHPYHLLGVALSKQNGLDMIEVPFKGAADENLAVLGNKIEVAIVSVASAKPLVEGGKLQMLAVLHPVRLAYLPNVPTFAELGYDVGFPPNYFSLFAPKDTPDYIIRKIHDAVKKAIEDEAFISAMNQAGIDIYYGSPDDVKNDMEKDRKVFGAMFKILGFVSS